MNFVIFAAINYIADSGCFCWTKICRRRRCSGTDKTDLTIYCFMLTGRHYHSFCISFLYRFPCSSVWQVNKIWFWTRTTTPTENDWRPLCVQSQGRGVDIARLSRRHRPECRRCVSRECHPCETAGPIARHEYRSHQFLSYQSKSIRPTNLRRRTISIDSWLNVFFSFSERTFGWRPSRNKMSTPQWCLSFCSKSSMWCTHTLVKSPKKISKIILCWFMSCWTVSVACDHQRLPIFNLDCCFCRNLGFRLSTKYGYGRFEDIHNPARNQIGHERGTGANHFTSIFIFFRFLSHSTLIENF